MVTIPAAADVEVIAAGVGNWGRVQLIDNARLGPLAAVCAARERWEFLLTSAPARPAGGTAPPLNPSALF